MELMTESFYSRESKNNDIRYKTTHRHIPTLII